MCICAYMDNKKYKISVNVCDPYSSTPHLKKKAVLKLQTKTYASDYRNGYPKTFRIMRFIVL